MTAQLDVASTRLRQTLRPHRDLLANSGSLTGQGARFVAGMRATIEPWLAESVPDSAARAASEWAARRRGNWQGSRQARDER